MDRPTFFPTISIDLVPRSGDTADTFASANGHTVLIVDDEHIIADTLSVIFTHNGYTVFTAYNGAHALQLALANPPQLLITDIKMPGISGTDLAIAITQTFPDCAVILFSGHVATLDVARRSGHHFTTLTKPVHPRTMLAHASTHLERRHSPHRYIIRTQTADPETAAFCSTD